MKEILIWILVVAGFLGFMVLMAGAPVDKVGFYEDNTIVCRRWTENWSLSERSQRKCWQLKEIKYENN